jgi:phage terminase large subunit
MADIQCTKVFKRNLEATKKIVINRGGTRSSKSYSICQQIARWLLSGEFRNNLTLKSGTVRVVRKYSATIDKTILIDFEEVLDSLDAWDDVEHNKTRKEYIFEAKGIKRVVSFMGADDQQKLRGMKQDILFCNEANELNYKAEFMQLLFRTTKLIILDFNPDDEDIWINTELEMKRKTDIGDVDVIVSTYKDNAMLDAELVKEIENLEITQPDYWQIYGMGEYGKIRGLIFKDINVVDKIPKDADLLGYGLDFGFSSDPAALIACYRYDGEIYLDELIYETGLTDDYLLKKINALGINRDLIVADAAEPKSIAYLQQNGCSNITPAKKGTGSISHGIRLMQGFKINVTERSLNLRKEFRHYKWVEDKNGDDTTKPIDMYNHGIDSVRYMLSNRYEKPADHLNALRKRRSRVEALQYK